MTLGGLSCFRMPETGSTILGPCISVLMINNTSISTMHYPTILHQMEKMSWQLNSLLNARKEL